jgi:exodeoxyribonuclease V alpha subunit
LAGSVERITFHSEETGFCVLRVKGIGPHFARKLVQAFGAEVFDVIAQTPTRLQELDGIGSKRTTRMVAAWAGQQTVREIMVFLHSHGVRTARAVRIYKTHGSAGVQGAEPP